MTETDLTSHRIEGFARAAIERGDDGRISLGLISHVEGNLWQGGCIDGARLPDDFRWVLSLYPWEQYRLGPNTTREEHRLLDSTDVLPAETLLALARRLNEMCRDGKTLVHCQAGLNRSGLIAALALMLRGQPAPEAIALLRRCRDPYVLCNPAFEKFLLELQVDGSQRAQ